MIVSYSGNLGACYLTKDVIAIVAGKKDILKNDIIVSKIQQLLSEHRYVELYELMQNRISQLSGSEAGELYLIRAQLKMFICDETMLDDFRMAKKLLPDGSRYSTMLVQIYYDRPDLLVCFRTEVGALSKFRADLQKSESLLLKLCGEVAVSVARLFQAETFYYTGQFDKAIALAGPVYETAARESSYMIAIYSGALLLRCYTAIGELLRVQNIVTQLIRYSKILSRPKYKELYGYVKAWLNYTTGWMGEMPRFLTAPNGIESIVLDDRIYYYTEMQISQSTRAEEGLIKLAELTVPGCVSVRQLHTDLFDAMISFKIGAREKASEVFYSAYSRSQKNRVIMPFVEYGRKILPLLQYCLAEKNGKDYARRWSDKLNQMATQYEESLRIIRGESARVSLLQEPLNNLELDILHLIVKGMTTSETAESLGIPYEDTKDSIRSIYRKIGAHNRAEAVAKALGGRIISMESNDDD